MLQRVSDPVQLKVPEPEAKQYAHDAHSENTYLALYLRPCAQGSESPEVAENSMAVM